MSHPESLTTKSTCTPEAPEEPLQPSASVIFRPTNPELVAVRPSETPTPGCTVSRYAELLTPHGTLASAESWRPARHEGASLEVLTDFDECTCSVWMICQAGEAPEARFPITYTSKGPVDVIALPPPPSRDVISAQPGRAAFLGSSRGRLAAKVATQSRPLANGGDTQLGRGLRNASTGESWTVLLAEHLGTLERSVAFVRCHLEVHVAFRKERAGAFATATVIRPVEFMIWFLKSREELPKTLSARVERQLATVAPGPAQESAAAASPSSGIILRLGTARLAHEQREQVMKGIIAFRAGLVPHGGHTVLRVVRAGEFIIFVHDAPKLEAKFVDDMSKKHLLLPRGSTLRVFPNVQMGRPLGVPQVAAAAAEPAKTDESVAAEAKGHSVCPLASLTTLGTRRRTRSAARGCPKLGSPAARRRLE